AGRARAERSEAELDVAQRRERRWRERKAGERGGRSARNLCSTAMEERHDSTAKASRCGHPRPLRCAPAQFAFPDRALSIHAMLKKTLALVALALLLPAPGSRLPAQDAPASRLPAQGCASLKDLRLPDVK